jgi:AcrR family transcriptional regulator
VKPCLQLPPDLDVARSIYNTKSTVTAQPIADAMSVTKAAVYHQFKTKEAIVLACTEIQLAALERHLDDAASGDPERTRREVLAAVIDLAVARRRTVGALQNDPTIARLLAEHPPFRQIQARLQLLLSGGAVTPTAKVRSAITSAVLTGAIAHPIVADIDDDTLRRELIGLVERLHEPGRRSKRAAGTSR